MKFALDHYYAMMQFSFHYEECSLKIKEIVTDTDRFLTQLVSEYT